MMKYTVHDFINKYKNKWINYCEVIIDDKGYIILAEPSHQEMLIKICMSKLRVTRKIPNNMCPVEFYADFTTWLCNQSNCVAVWYNSYESRRDNIRGPGDRSRKLNRFQKRTIELLNESGLTEIKIDKE